MPTTDDAFAGERGRHRLVEGDVLVRVRVERDDDHVPLDGVAQPVDHRHHARAVVAGRARLERERARDEVVLHVDDQEGAHGF